MKKLKSIILAFTFFSFSSTSLFSIHNRDVKALGCIAFNLLKLGAAIGSDKLYREDNKKFNKIFKTYLALDSVDSILKTKNFSAAEGLGGASGYILLYDLFLIFNKNKKKSNKIIADKEIENNETVDDVEIVLSETEDREEEKESHKLQKSLIVLKNSLFFMDAISSLAQNISYRRDEKVMWGNVGDVAKILARSIDTKNCSVVKKGFFFALATAVGSYGQFRSYNDRVRERNQRIDRELARRRAEEERARRNPIGQWDTGDPVLRDLPDDISLQQITNILDREETDCSICLDCLRRGNNIVVIDGDHHLFHKNCLEDWMRACDQQYNLRTNPLTREPLAGGKVFTLSEGAEDAEAVEPVEAADDLNDE